MNGKPSIRSTGGAFATPLRYPGGKGRLGPWLASVLEANGLRGGWYVEPYAGGAGAALYLLTHEYVEHIVINDLDPLICAFWRAATEYPEALATKVATTPVTMDTWLAQRALVNATTTTTTSTVDLVDLGFAALFLNRTNRSGILSAGVIGGKSQAGTWKIDARYVKEVLCDRIRLIGRLAKRISVVCMDAVDLLTDVAPGFPERCLVYLDPPYFMKGSLLYRNHYEDKDHAAIASCAALASYPLVLTYDNCPQIRSLYRGFPSTKYSLKYSAHRSGKVAEEMLFYRNLTIPSTPFLSRGSVGRCSTSADAMYAA